MSRNSCDIRDKIVQICLKPDHGKGKREPRHRWIFTGTTPEEAANILRPKKSTSKINKRFKTALDDAKKILDFYKQIGIR